MDDIRAQLDALMGQHRDVPLSERDKYKQERKFSDPDICKYHLCGFCPYEEFRRTKNDCGDCPLVHDDACKQQWDELDEASRARYGYESELLQWFDKLLGDLRKRIDGNSERLKAVDEPLVLPEDQQRLDNLTTQIKELLGRAATLGEQGEVDAAQAAAAEADQLRVQHTMLEQTAQARANARTGRNLHQKVCQVSGLIINDEESRLQDHYSGRNYNSWKKLHEVHAKLVEAQRKRMAGPPLGAPLGHQRDSAPGPRSGSRDRDYRGSYRDDRGRGGERDARGRERDGGSRRYDRERDERGSRRPRSRSRSRERRERDRRDRERDGGGRRRYDDRDRERERERAAGSGRKRSRSRERTRSAHTGERQAPAAAAAMPPPPPVQ
ncbi:hypothetical protein D9Q98_004618 [Chlorella vulgaris]|uniref:Luc7-like protein 3 n=1 Tax=Chlorella vulgaris TaxID=3077 RepID=A0A9D4YXL6_CHLVU|nr:hypothetical protein D9Q98_004618 [Chlorella vulgaris]